MKLSEKELSFLNDAMTEEKLLINKYIMLAEQSDDETVRSKYQEISHKHQEHFNALYSQLG